jgi:predicted CoA-binding protein
MPINPTTASITTTSPAAETATLPSIAALPSPTTTSLSIITPPRATLKILQEAKELGIPAVWLQPGTFDDEVLGFAQREFKAAVGGEGGAGGEGGWVLVDGERALEAVGRGKL